MCVSKVARGDGFLNVNRRRLIINVHLWPSGMRSLEEVKGTFATIPDTKERWEREVCMGKVTAIGGDVQLAGNVEGVIGDGAYTSGEKGPLGQGAW